MDLTLPNGYQTSDYAVLSDNDDAEKSVDDAKNAVENVENAVDDRNWFYINSSKCLGEGICASDDKKYAINLNDVMKSAIHNAIVNIDNDVKPCSTSTLTLNTCKEEINIENDSCVYSKIATNGRFVKEEAFEMVKEDHNIVDKNSSMGSPDDICNYSKNAGCGIDRNDNSRNSFCAVKVECSIDDAKISVESPVNTSNTDSNTHTSSSVHEFELENFNNGGVNSDLNCTNNDDAPKKQWKCNICSFETRSAGVLGKHFKTHSAKDPFTCPVCDYRASSRSLLKTHMVDHTKGCSKIRVSEMHKLVTQMQMSDQTRKPMLHCQKCDFKTTEKQQLSAHRKTHGTKTRLYACTLCNYTAGSRREITPHLMTHTKEEQLKCNQCDFRSFSKEAIAKHEMAHTVGAPAST